MEKDKKEQLRFSPIFWVALLLALMVRTSGLFHGLEERHSFHPDTLKQVQALHNFLNGKILWYTDSLAYDGYPYGLNHVDATLVRLTWPVIRGTASWFNPSLHFEDIPSLSQLFVLCRVFRVFYGMLAFALFARLLHRRLIPDFQMRLWLLTAALAPLLSTVTHSASGDVGTDLFVMAAVTALFHGLPKPGWRHYALTGFFLGCGFATKYHAVLAGALPGLCWLLLEDTARRRIRHLAACGIGFFAGTVLLTPQFWIRPEKTVSLIRDNIGYIRHYGVEDAFFEQPFLTRLSQSLASNVPLVLNTFGMVLFLTLALALFAGLFKGWRAKALRSPGLVWDVSLLIMGFGVILFSITAKPAVQPFHFSFLTLPLLLGAAGIWKRKPFPGSTIWIAILLLTQIAIDIGRQRHEIRMWGREDTRALVRRYQEDLLYPVADPQARTLLGTIALEGDNLAVFRNRPQDLWLDEVGPWGRHPNQWLPATPYHFSPDWLILDLPHFLRDDRLMHLRADAPVERTVVADALHDRIPLKVQCGQLPAKATIHWNGTRFDLDLSPGESRTLQVSGGNGSRFSREQHERFRHRFQASAKGGDLLLRLGKAPTEDTGSEQDLERKFIRSRFLEGTVRPNYDTLVSRSVHLAPAVYRFEIDHPSAVPPPVLEIDPAQVPHPDKRLSIPLEVQPGGKVAALIPLRSPELFTRLRLVYPYPPPMNATWTLNPVQSVPDRVARMPAPPAPAFRSRVAFLDRDVTLGNIRLIMADGGQKPLVNQLIMDAGSPSRLTLRAKTSLNFIPDRWRKVAFVHVLDDQGHQVIAQDFPLDSIPDIRSGMDLSWDIGLDRLAPGDYTLLFGLYDPATRRRHAPRLLEAEPGPDQRAFLATLRIL